MPEPQDKDTPKDIDALVPLLALSNLLGPIYGSEDISMFLYTLIRRERPRNIVELGTGIGVSTFWMAQALKELGDGQVWTVDDGSDWQEEGRLQQAIAIIRERPPFDALPEGELDYPGFIIETAKLLKLSERVNFANERIDLTDEDILTKRGYPFLKEPVDLVFADLRHGPQAILNVFFHFLPHLSESGSIFIDSASSSLSSFLFLEKFIAQLNQSKVPRRFLMTQQPRHSRVLMDLVAIRRFTLLHLIERRARRQNSTAWIKVEPVDYLPHPMTFMKK